MLDVHDDGVGFDPQILAHLPNGNQGGFGLHSMGQRVAQFGGKVIADDHPIVLDGLRGILISQSEFEIVGEATNGADAARLAVELKPDVVLMDLRMPVMDGVSAIRASARGEPILAPTVAAWLIAQVRTPAEDKLSNREIEVLELVAEGASNSDIAGRLHISQATVKSHLINIFGKLGVSDRTAAVTVALQRGILHLEH